ncbi:MAG TPA: DUF5995 family protein [Eudoraea sp.]|nr:DUF5995 family protein [Eudoraea sp.]
MKLEEIKTIDEIIAILGNIILESEANNNPLGYFAVLYQKVTIKVKEGIETNFFNDGDRMGTLDVVFAKRYLQAYYDYQKNEPVTTSWQTAFTLSKNYWPVVLQHLLVGINAHINLDLGIAAAEISKNKNLGDLEDDFNRINEILASLVNEVQDDLSRVWPTLKKILQKTRNVDDFLIDFSMELARDGAWMFAKSLAHLPDKELDSLIAARDQKITEKMNIITKPGFIARVILGVIRLGEKGSVAGKIRELKKALPSPPNGISRP